MTGVVRDVQVRTTDQFVRLDFGGPDGAEGISQAVYFVGSW